MTQKHQFSQYASHAFRSPVAVIKSSAEVIEEIVKEDNNNLSPYVMRIHYSLVRMESAISTTKALEIDFAAKDNPVVIAPPPLLKAIIDNLVRNVFQ